MAAVTTDDISIITINSIKHLDAIKGSHMTIKLHIDNICTCAKQEGTVTKTEK